MFLRQKMVWHFLACKTSFKNRAAMRAAHVTILTFLLHLLLLLPEIWQVLPCPESLTE